MKAAVLMVKAFQEIPGYIVSTEEMEASRAWLEQEEELEMGGQRSEVREGRFTPHHYPFIIADMIDPEVIKRHTAAKALDIHQK